MNLFYIEEAGDKGAAPAPFPCTPNPCRSSSASLRTISVDEAEHFRHNHHAQRRFGPTAVQLRPGTPFGFPLESAFTFTGILSMAEAGASQRDATLLRKCTPPTVRPLIPIYAHLSYWEDLCFYEFFA